MGNFFSLLTAETPENPEENDAAEEVVVSGGGVVGGSAVVGGEVVVVSGEDIDDDIDVVDEVSDGDEVIVDVDDESDDEDGEDELWAVVEHFLNRPVGGPGGDVPTSVEPDEYEPGVTEDENEEDPIYVPVPDETEDESDEEQDQDDSDLSSPPLPSLPPPRHVMPVESFDDWIQRIMGENQGRNVTSDSMSTKKVEDLGCCSTLGMEEDKNPDAKENRSKEEKDGKCNLKEERMEEDKRKPDVMENQTNEEDKVKGSKSNLRVEVMEEEDKRNPEARKICSSEQNEEIDGESGLREELMEEDKRKPDVRENQANEDNKVEDSKSNIKVNEMEEEDKRNPEPRENYSSEENEETHGESSLRVEVIENQFKAELINSYGVNENEMEAKLVKNLSANDQDGLESEMEPRFANYLSAIERNDVENETRLGGSLSASSNVQDGIEHQIAARPAVAQYDSDNDMKVSAPVLTQPQCQLENRINCDCLTDIQKALPDPGSVDNDTTKQLGTPAPATHDLQGHGGNGNVDATDKEMEDRTSACLTIPSHLRPEDAYVPYADETRAGRKRTRDSRAEDAVGEGKRRRMEDEDDKERQKLERQNQRKEKSEALKATLRASLPPEPPAANTDTVIIMVACTDGTVLQRAFTTSQPIKQLWDFVFSQPNTPDDFVLSQHYQGEKIPGSPPKVDDDENDITLQEESENDCTFSEIGLMDFEVIFLTQKNL